MKYHSKKIFRLILILLFCISCREEIIPPDNLIENINEPVQIRNFNSYVFLLNAESFTMNLNIPSTFTSIKTRFNIKLIDYGSGYTTISVLDNNSVERFRYFAGDEVLYDSELLDGFVPASIQIRTSDFSGKLRIEFRKTL